MYLELMTNVITQEKWETILNENITENYWKIHYLIPKNQQDKPN
jgi:hypothetical protein